MNRGGDQAKKVKPGRGPSPWSQNSETKAGLGARWGFTARLAWAEEGKATAQRNTSRKAAANGNQDPIGEDSHR
jgi:hypothetical protein